jgi:hypothetical protein
MKQGQQQRTTDREATKASQEATLLDQSRLLVVFNMTKKSIYHRASSRREETAWPLEALTGRRWGRESPAASILRLGMPFQVQYNSREHLPGSQESSRFQVHVQLSAGLRTGKSVTVHQLNGGNSELDPSYQVCLSAVFQECKDTCESQCKGSKGNTPAPAG